MSVQDKTTKLEKKAYIWNTMAGLVNAAEAVFMSMIVTRTTGLTDAGILTIAFAIGNLMMPIAKFGVRNYQVTDVQNRFSFSIYLKARLFTVILMVLTLIGYLLYASTQLNYGRDKVSIIFAICMIYTVESLEDVVWGYYQRRGRIDVGARMFCFRWCGIFIIFWSVLRSGRDLATALFCCLPVSLFIFIVLLRISYLRVCDENERVVGLIIHKEDVRRIGELLVKVFPLFGITFLSFYVNNAPKYAIDRCLSDEVQACYGFVAMPVFVIALLNNFVYQPTLVLMAVEWEKKLKKKFVNRIWRQLGVIGVMSVICLAGAYWIGIPVLSWLYHTDLSAYKQELMVLLMAGGFLAVSGYLSVVLTIMRCQQSLLWSYCLVSAVAVIGLQWIVAYHGTIGAALSYLCLMVLLCLLYGMILIKKLRIGNET